MFRPLCWRNFQTCVTKIRKCPIKHRSTQVHMLRVAARQVSVHAPTTCHWLTKLTARTIHMASAAAPAAAAGGTSRYSCSTSSVSDVQVVTIVDTEGGVQASIAPSRGAELCSLQVCQSGWVLPPVLDLFQDPVTRRPALVHSHTGEGEGRVAGGAGSCQ